MKRLSNTIIESSLQPYGVTTTALLCDQIRVYIDLLLRWNQKTSLTAVTDPTEILRFHFGESLLAVATVPYGTVGSPTLVRVLASQPYQSVWFRMK